MQVIDTTNLTPRGFCKWMGLSTTKEKAMFTIKYTDRDGMERLAQGRDIRVVKDGRQAKSLGWLDCVAGEGCQINFPTTAYVMNESGATVAKYVVIGDKLSDAEVEAMRKHWQTEFK